VNVPVDCDGDDVPEVNVTLWMSDPFHVHVTVVPCASVVDEGLKLLSRTLI
jgi:hypothetical protein